MIFARGFWALVALELMTVERLALARRDCEGYCRAGPDLLRRGRLGCGLIPDDVDCIAQAADSGRAGPRNVVIPDPLALEGHLELIEPHQLQGKRALQVAIKGPRSRLVSQHQRAGLPYKRRAGPVIPRLHPCARQSEHSSVQARQIVGERLKLRITERLRHLDHHIERGTSAGT